ncbi:calcium-binding protein [Actinoplanes sp. NPDC051475]|uniref:calcium-binding protein n=1 Tax=Actinoplanes sp. NPDC051475 TaxID=3157225 RepID=UPI00344FA507
MAMSFPPRLAHITLGLTVVAAATTAIGTPALAATPGVAKVVGSATVSFTAAAGNKNAVVVTRSGKTITIDDRVKVKAGHGCVAVRGDATKVRCKTADAPTYVTVNLGDLNDSVTNKSDLGIVALGSAGDDTLTGGPGNDSLSGGAGNDKLVGKDGIDSLTGDAGNDRLDGGTGGDVFIGGAGADTVIGGAGADTVMYTDHTAAVIADLDGVAGDDGQRNEKDTLQADVENLYGGSGNDTLTGNAAVNVISGGAGNDTIRGGTANDVLSGDDGDDNLYGDDGADVLTGAKGNDTIHGGEGNDIGQGGLGSDHLYGEGGDDFLTGDGDSAALDVLDGGLDGATGDFCLVAAAGTKTNCEM